MGTSFSAFSDTQLNKGKIKVYPGRCVYLRFMSGKLGVAEACGCSCTTDYLPLLWFFLCPVCRVMPSTVMTGPACPYYFMPFDIEMAESLLIFFLTDFLFCWFQSLIDPFFSLPFFPCLSVLRWTWPIGEFSGVYLLCSVSFLVSFYLVEVE